MVCNSHLGVRARPVRLDPAHTHDLYRLSLRMRRVCTLESYVGKRSVTGSVGGQREGRGWRPPATCKMALSSIRDLRLHTTSLNSQDSQPLSTLLRIHCFRYSDPKNSSVDSNLSPTHPHFSRISVKHAARCAARTRYHGYVEALGSSTPPARPQAPPTGPMSSGTKSRLVQIYALAAAYRTATAWRTSKRTW